MTTTTQTYAQQLGRAFAQAARGDTAVIELWVSVQQEAAHLWLVTRPIDLSAERRLHGLTGVLYDTFGRADFQVHILNPRNIRGDVHDALPAQAEQISLNAP